MSLFKKSSPLVRRKSTVANRGASQPTALESSMNLDQTHQSQLGTSGQWTLPHQQQSAMQPQAPPQGYAQPQHQSQAGLSSSLLQTTPMPFQPSNTGLLMASTATAVPTGTTAVVAPAPTPNAPPLAVNLGTAQLYFENGVWRSVGGDVAMGSADQVALVRENRRLLEENNMLRYKMEVLLDMLTVSNLDALKVEQELAALSASAM